MCLPNAHASAYTHGNSCTPFCEFNFWICMRDWWPSTGSDYLPFLEVREVQSVLYLNPHIHKPKRLVCFGLPFISNFNMKHIDFPPCFGNWHIMCRLNPQMQSRPLISCCSDSPWFLGHHQILSEIGRESKNKNWAQQITNWAKNNGHVLCVHAKPEEDIWSELIDFHNFLLSELMLPEFSSVPQLEPELRNGTISSGFQFLGMSIFEELKLNYQELFPNLAILVVLNREHNRIGRSSSRNFRNRTPVWFLVPGKAPEWDQTELWQH